ncbi:Uncharacterized FAD-binding protein C17H9.12c [Taphrina deformans PYCC 5710]|uniref:Uncharacterized FAD-binding protein C17H9.12c n=1 Tax=Taphrina deformans (strain PYCC 5710 / ATCC 11124 / CBS 356.35 / IMI 108563 / JCM 9778 / NBRC 8474) TaxID=1097556 RepID=R4X8C2_TAPDE|nr:Uncharacterized FAD-binding protein C17H9.12c [Taphrina deformans PYCC 5710]|eukprot:CCG81803.1 Uncharacterized FAD-binding protein C17H9.12c [Taphrina deformans PYCC 5710]
MLGVRSFSHTYRKRQLAPIKAYLPSYSLGAHNRRYISSVTSGNVGSDSAQGSRTSRVAWATRVMAAGITVILALRFLEDKAEVESHGLSDSVYTAWEIFNVEQVSPSASVFTLKAKPGATVSGFVPLSSVSIKEPNSNIQRPYTILSLEEDRIKILVKRYDGGELSRFIHSRKLEAELFLKRVPSEYTLPEKVPSKFVLISGGTGVATSYQLLRHFATLPAQDRPEVRVLYASVNEDEVYLQEEFKELKESLGGKLHIEYFIDSWGAVIDSKDVQNAYRDWESATTLVCGSDGFVEFIAGRKPEIGQGSIGGLLAANGIGENVWKL